MDKQEKIMELMKDKAFAEKLFACKELKDIQALLKENGVDMTDEEMAEIQKTLDSAAK